MPATQVIIDRTMMKEGVRICKSGCNLRIVSAADKLLDEVIGTDIAAFAEALQAAQIRHQMVVADQVIQITR